MNLAINFDNEKKLEVYHLIISREREIVWTWQTPQNFSKTKLFDDISGFISFPPTGSD